MNPSLSLCHTEEEKKKQKHVSGSYFPFEFNHREAAATPATLPAHHYKITHGHSGPSFSKLPDERNLLPWPLHLDNVQHHIHNWVCVRAETCVCVHISVSLSLYGCVLRIVLYHYFVKVKKIYSHIASKFKYVYVFTCELYSLNLQVSWMTATATRAAILAKRSNNTPAMRHL